MWAAAPELLKDEEYGRSQDTWSLGCILFYMITLQHPFGSLTDKKFAKNVVTKEPNFDLIPAGYELSKKMLKKMLIKDGNKRPKLADLFPELKEVVIKLLEK